MGIMARATIIMAWPRVRSRRLLFRVIILSTIESPAVLILVIAKVCDCLWVRTYYAKARSRNRLRMLAGAPSAMTTCLCRRNGHDPGPALEVVTPVSSECHD